MAQEQIEGLNRLYDRNDKKENMFRVLSGHKTARDVIFKPSNDKYINARPEGMAIRSQFEDFVTNTQDYKLDFTKGIDSDYQIIIKNKEDKQVGSVPLNNSISIETFEKAFQGTPQVFLAMYSKLQVDKYMQSIINGR